MSIYQKKVSIVVPVYNAAQTIERCVKSILNQTYHHIELILVDDGSKDNSLEVCRKLQNEDERIIVASGENAGVSVARNKGIEIASGEYIAFVDADDYVKPDMYEKLINIAERRKVSLVFCNYEEMTIKGESREIDQLSQLNQNNECANNIDIIEHLLQISDTGIFGVCWRTLFDRNVLRENSIRFTTGITMSEDLKFVLECLGVTLQSGICNEYLYSFFVTGTTTSKYMKKQEQDMHDINMWIREFIEGLQESRNLQLNSNITMANTVVTNAANVCKKLSPFGIRERVRHVRMKRKQVDYGTALKIAFYNRKLILKKRWIQMGLIYFHLEILVVLYHSMKYKNFKKYTLR